MIDPTDNRQPSSPETPAADVASSVWDPWLLALYALELQALRTPTVH